LFFTLNPHSSCFKALEQLYLSVSLFGDSHTSWPIPGCHHPERILQLKPGVTVWWMAWREWPSL